jgi:hypothetical protein
MAHLSFLCCAVVRRTPLEPIDCNRRMPVTHSAGHGPVRIQHHLSHGGAVFLLTFLSPSMGTRLSQSE